MNRAELIAQAKANIRPKGNSVIDRDDRYAGSVPPTIPDAIRDDWRALCYHADPDQLAGALGITPETLGRVA